jgi:hypothetical protein
MRPKVPAERSQFQSYFLQLEGNSTVTFSISGKTSIGTYQAKKLQNQVRNRNYDRNFSRICNLYEKDQTMERIQQSERTKLTSYFELNREEIYKHYTWDTTPKKMEETEKKSQW